MARPAVEAFQQDYSRVTDLEAALKAPALPLLRRKELESQVEAARTALDERLRSLRDLTIATREEQAMKAFDASAKNRSVTPEARRTALKEQFGLIREGLPEASFEEIARLKSIHGVNETALVAERTKLQQEIHTNEALNAPERFNEERRERLAEIEKVLDARRGDPALLAEKAKLEKQVALNIALNAPNRFNEALDARIKEITRQLGSGREGYLRAKIALNTLVEGIDTTSNELRAAAEAQGQKFEAVGGAERVYEVDTELPAAAMLVYRSTGVLTNLRGWIDRSTTRAADRVLREVKAVRSGALNEGAQKQILDEAKKRLDAAAVFTTSAVDGAKESFQQAMGTSRRKWMSVIGTLGSIAGAVGIGKLVGSIANATNALPSVSPHATPGATPAPSAAPAPGITPTTVASTPLVPSTIPPEVLAKLGTPPHVWGGLQNLGVHGNQALAELCTRINEIVPLASHPGTGLLGDNMSQEAIMQVFKNPLVQKLVLPFIH